MSNESRSSAWILTCESWMQQQAYLVLPINPGSLSFDIGVRTSNQMARAANMIYVWRGFGKKSMQVKPTINVTANSGYIVPSFDPSVILDCHELVLARANAGSNTESTLTTETQKRYYDSALADYAHLPGPEQIRDYIATGVYKDVGANIKPNPVNIGSDNVPDIYSEDNSRVPVGVQNLYALFSLADERRIRNVYRRGDTPDNPTGGQAGNRIMLILSTMVFPRLVVYGWFGESGITYTDDVENQGSFDVNFDIIVDETVPGLGFGQWQNLMATYTSSIGSSVSTLDTARQQNNN